MAAEVPPCGTMRAHQRHVRRHEPVCDRCRQARRDYDRGRYVPHGPERQPCGSDGAYQRHLRSGETACQLCKDAHAEQGRIFRAEAAARQEFDAMLAEVWAEVAAA